MPTNIAYERLRNPALQDVCDGAFVRFGTETAPAQVIPGATKCTTGVLRCNPDGTISSCSHGACATFGLQHHPDGRLFATDHGIDEHGSRFIVGDPDDVYEVTAAPGTAFSTTPRAGASTIRIGARRRGDSARHRRRWRTRRTETDAADVPPEPLVLPVNLLRALVPAAGVAAAAVALVGRRARRGRTAKTR